MAVTTDDYRKRLADVYGELYPVGGDADPVLDLAAAAAEVDAYAAVRYRLPLAASALVDGWIVTLAEELAWSRGISGKLPDNVKRRVDTVRKQLEQLAGGQLRLPGQADADTGMGAALTVECAEPVFGRKNMDGY